VYVVLSFFHFFLFFGVVVRLHTDTAETVCTRKMITITHDLYIDDDVAGYLTDCYVSRMSKK
jgi:hypothetical protein